MGYTGAVPIHLLLSNPADPKMRAGVHFALQQIRKIGLLSGLSKGVYAPMLYELTDEEERLRRDKLRAYLELLMKLSHMSFDLGQDIIRLQDDIGESLRTIDKKIDKLEDDDPQLAALREDRKTLENAQKDIVNIDEERMRAQEPEQVETARARLDRLVGKIRKPLERNEHDTPFNFQADPDRRQPAANDALDTPEDEENDLDLGISPSGSSSSGSQAENDAL
ncbi:MAG: hypothetical protein H6861_02625 [Rhodospirillales bacterium]|nr:hypothetical protein [Rhodospirillales bacterium]